MISLKSSEQLELSFSPRVCWRKLCRDRQHEILDQLSLLLLSHLADEAKQDQSEQEDQLCPVK